MAEIDRKEFETWMNLIRGDISGVHSRLDELNGRTRTAENQIAVLKDRSDRTTDPAARWAAGVSLVAGVLMEVAHRVWGAK